MNILAFKLILIPALTCFVSWVQRRFSHHLGGMISGLPMTAGPIMVFLAVEQGQDFARHAAMTAFPGHLCLSAFIISYCTAALRFRWPKTLMIAIAAWVCAFLLVAQIPMTQIIAIILGICAVLINFTYARSQSCPHPVRVKPMRHELLIRSVLTLVPLLTITGIAHVIGPKYSGLLAGFPVAWSIIFPFTLQRGGRDSVISFLRGSALGMLGYMTFFLLLIFGTSDNIWVWFGVAVAGAIVVGGLANAARSILMPSTIMVEPEGLAP